MSNGFMGGFFKFCMEEKFEAYLRILILDVSVALLFGMLCLRPTS